LKIFYFDEGARVSLE